MLTKYRRVVSIINQFQVYACEDPTKNQVANEMGRSISRATTYRWIKKAINVGLIECQIHSWGHTLSVTEKGQEFLGAWHEIPF